MLKPSFYTRLDLDNNIPSHSEEQNLIKETATSSTPIKQILVLTETRLTQRINEICSVETSLHACIKTGAVSNHHDNQLQVIIFFKRSSTLYSPRILIRELPAENLKQENSV